MKPTLSAEESEKIQNALHIIHEYNMKGQIKKDALDFIRKILRTIILNPSHYKYRTVKRNAESYQFTVLTSKNTETSHIYIFEDLLLACNFQYVDYLGNVTEAINAVSLNLPADIPMTKIVEYRDLIEKAMTEIEITPEVSRKTSEQKPNKSNNSSPSVDMSANALRELQRDRIKTNSKTYNGSREINNEAFDQSSPNTTGERSSVFSTVGSFFSSLFGQRSPNHGNSPNNRVATLRTINRPVFRPNR